MSFGELNPRFMRSFKPLSVRVGTSNKAIKTNFKKNVGYDIYIDGTPGATGSPGLSYSIDGTSFAQVTGLTLTNTGAAASYTNSSAWSTSSGCVGLIKIIQLGNPNSGNYFISGQLYSTAAGVYTITGAVLTGQKLITALQIVAGDDYNLTVVPIPR